MGIKEFFTGKKKTELEKATEERGICESKIRELQADLKDYESVKRQLELEIKIDEKNTSLKGRLNKVVGKIEEVKTEIAETEKRAQVLSQDINKLNQDKFRQEIEELAEEDIKHYETYMRAKKLLNELDRMTYEIEANCSYIGATKPDNLLRKAGVERGKDFSLDNPEHAPFMKVWREKEAESDEQIDKELEELKKQIRTYLNKCK